MKIQQLSNGQIEVSDKKGRLTITETKGFKNLDFSIKNEDGSWELRSAQSEDARPYFIALHNFENDLKFEMELHQQREAHKIEHQAEFKKWAKENNLVLADEMGGFKVGQKVTYTNSYGVRWEGHTIMGFEQPDKYGNCVYLDTDCYWCSKKLHEISIESN